MIGYLGLGSNVGDRLASLRAARSGVEHAGVRVIRASSVWETEPQGEVPDQPDFLNACLEVETDLRPEDLLGVCKEAERALGRAPGGVRQGPRTIDIDVLLLGRLEHASARLTLPHPELLTRRFALAPLVELDPHLTLPGGERLADALEALSGQRVARIGPL